MGKVLKIQLLNQAGPGFRNSYSAWGHKHRCRGKFFLIADVTDYQKLGSSKQYKFITLWFWRAKVQYGSHEAKIKVLAGLHSF